MIVTLNIRTEEFPDSPHIVTETGSPDYLMHWLSGFLTAGVIVDRMAVMGK